MVIFPFIWDNRAMKKALIIMLLMLTALSLYSSRSIEVGSGAAYNNTMDSFVKPFLDVTYTLDRFSFYLDWKYDRTLTGYVQYNYDEGIWNHQADITTRYIFGEGGYSALSYMFIVNLSKSGFFLNIGLGAAATLSFSQYTVEPLFMLCKLMRLRTGYSGERFSAYLFLENNYRHEREWNPKEALGIALAYNITDVDTVTLDVAATSCEMLIDPYRIFYSGRARVGYRRVL